MAAYYNEIDKFAAQWLHNLIAEGLIAPGDVDERSIEDVRPDDLKGYTQCHFFAGIGVWSHALRRAGWNDDRPVWTGSCPCQPFSTAGKGGGFDDERHLWPAWHHLIRVCRPPVVFGEQVAAKDGLMWLDLIHADLEDEGYAVGPVDLCAASFGAPHRRQRLFFVAYDDDAGQRRQPHAGLRRSELHDPDRCGADGIVANSSSTGLEGRRSDGLQRLGECPAGSGGVARLVALSDDPQRRPDAPGGDECDRHDPGRPEGASDAEGRGEFGIVGDSSVRRNASVTRDGDCAEGAFVGDDGSVSGASATIRVASLARQLADDDERRDRRGEGSELSGWREPSNDSDTSQLADANGGDTGAERQQRSRKHRQQPQDGTLGVVGGSGPTDGFWRDADWLLCRDPDDPKWRPVEPATFPLVDEYPARVGKLRAYGNAIVAEVAAGFVEAYLEHEAEARVEDLV